MNVLTPLHRRFAAALALAMTGFALSAAPATATVTTTSIVTAAAPAQQTVSPLERIRGMDPQTYERKVRRQINKKRANHNLSRVKGNACAARIAQDWSDYLAPRFEFFHQDLSPFFKKCNTTYAGETLARGAITPKRMVRLWMESPGHRRILLSKSPRKVGLGATLDPRGDWVVTADFIR